MSTYRSEVIRKHIPFVILACICLVRSLHAHGISDADKESMLLGGLLEYGGLGASHMLTGYDHLLFLFGVVFFLTGFKDVVKFITAFTIGHCITLIAATYMKITANYFAIDAVIALTVIYKGFDNIGGFKKYLGMRSPNLLVMVFIFGLIHGFGLSTRLQQLPLGTDGLLMKILSFNVGVEVGQIAALSVMLLVLAAWRRTASFERLSAASNVGLMIAGALLFLMQMHGLMHQMEESEQAAQTHQHVTELREDTVSITVPGGKSLEYKLSIPKGSQVKYAWKTDGKPLYFDLHGDPKAGGTFTSYEKGTDANAEGILTAPFDGSHGWYWKNSSTEDTMVTLEISGVYRIIGVQ